LAVSAGELVCRVLVDAADSPASIATVTADKQTVAAARANTLFLNLIDKTS
jgi:hypothetical protein